MAQFKNRFTTTNLCYTNEEDFGVNGRVGLFASSHGKGSVDAIWGTVKRTVWTYTYIFIHKMQIVKF